MLIHSINNCLGELIELLDQLCDEEYRKPCSELSGASIGDHTRHIVEMFQCLENQFESGIVDYDQRKRNILMQANIDFARQEIIFIQNNLDKENVSLILKHKIDGYEIQTESNYYRELLYNFEHCIHHQALIKVALLQLSNIKIDDNFGVARSTIEYRKECAQ